VGRNRLCRISQTCGFLFCSRRWAHQCRFGCCTAGWIIGTSEGAVDLLEIVFADLGDFIYGWSNIWGCCGNH